MHYLVYPSQNFFSERKPAALWTFAHVSVTPNAQAYDHCINDETHHGTYEHVHINHMLFN